MSASTGVGVGSFQFIDRVLNLARSRSPLRVDRRRARASWALGLRVALALGWSESCPAYTYYKYTHWWCPGVARSWGEPRTQHVSTHTRTQHTQHTYGRPFPPGPTKQSHQRQRPISPACRSLRARRGRRASAGRPPYPTVWLRTSVSRCWQGTRASRASRTSVSTDVLEKKF